jgi:hypothetical protein
MVSVFEVKKSISIKIQLFSGLLQYLPPNADISGWMAIVEDGITIQDLLAQINIPVDSSLIITVNDTNETSEYSLKNLDFVKLFPIAMGG